ncbi:hypothetical protein NFX39_04815 [Fructobacillus sp. W13]|uniref:Uncharacterized protein n=1 Tax=Fructobacillus apis TaxID=2935017 RepID=A0ABT0ZQZ3_9LACO|nr:pectate lyase-like adhesive domain-containing protein [Fructobacillus apis]MCO0832400.1 hypothetical protein [Fructobacillus apis]
MKKMLLVLAALCGLFFVHTENASANYTNHTDNTGQVTGEKGATYYNVSSWEEMFDAYSDSDESTVYLNVTDDIKGSQDAYTGERVSEGKSLKIIGNGHTLYFGQYADPTRGTSIGESSSKTSGFYADRKQLTSKTTMTLENAKWVNSINYGIFEVSGDASVTTVYKDVTETNGAVLGGTAIMNRAGAIKFYGTNTFNITGALGKDWGSGKQDPTKFGAKLTEGGGYVNANWIQGGNDITVYDGSTTVNSNAMYQKTIHHFDSSNFDDQLTVKSNAKMVWNLDNVWFLEERPVKSKTWNIEDNAQFLINGTKNTCRSTIENEWFGRGAEADPWTVNVGKKGVFDAQTAGAINLLTYGNRNVAWNVASRGTFAIRNLSTDQPLVTGRFGTGINLAKNAHMVLQANNQIFKNLSDPINLNGSGLPVSTSRNFDGSNATKGPESIGRIGMAFGLGSFLSPEYPKSLLTELQNAHYIEWGHGTPVVSFGQSILDRLFKFSSDSLPKSGLSAFIPGQDKMSFTVNSNMADPDVSVQARISKQSMPNTFHYSWMDNKGNVTGLSSDPKTIWTMKDGYDYREDFSGYNYTANYDRNHGLMLQTTNQLKSGTYDDATIDYTLVDGPTSSDD